MPPKPLPPLANPPPSDGYGEALRREPERITTPGIPKLRLPPAVPQAAPLDEKTPPSVRMPVGDPPRARQRPPLPTKPGLGNAPESVSGEPPRSVSPIPWDPAADQVEQAARRRGDRVVKPPVAEHVPVSVPPESELQGQAHVPWWRTTMGMVKVIGALTLAIPATTAATTTAVVSIINALKQPTDPKLRADVDEIRSEVTSLRGYLRDRDTARERELEVKFNALRAKDTELDLRYPAPKVDPNRPPNLP